MVQAQLKEAQGQLQAETAGRKLILDWLDETLLLIKSDGILAWKVTQGIPIGHSTNQIFGLRYELDDPH